MICPYCKKETKANSTTCQNCGKLIDIKDRKPKNILISIIIICATIVVLALLFVFTVLPMIGKSTDTNTMSERSDTIISTESTSKQPNETSSSSASASPTPTNPGTRMYTSYATMVSYNPATGSAKFDYWDMLKGEEAIAWLIANEGYTQFDAETEVNNYADSEFVKKNTSTNLREIDLRNVSIKLMYHSDGTMVSGAEGTPSTLSDINALYHVDPEKVLKTHYYKIHVDDNERVTLVEQMYAP